MEQQEFDLLVIGAGISGAGVARDAAMRGMQVCLVEARDIASGTSSKSSKMIHGGLRYLAQGDVGLVSEAAQERRTLRQIAPHLATTLPMIVTSKKKTGLAKFRTGLWTYEKLGKVALEEKHENLDVKELSKREPYLRVSELAGAVQFPEYLTDDARLTLANVRSAVEAGAKVATYAEVKEILVNQDARASGARASGARICGALPNETFNVQVRAKLVVNAAGPWVDGIRKLEDDRAPKKNAIDEGYSYCF